jgi:hypothetical protein
MFELTKCAKLTCCLVLSVQASTIAPANGADRAIATTARPAKLEGMPYSEAREIISQFGWISFKGDCSGPPVNESICSHFPEIGYCSGSGVGFCGMYFYRKNRCLILVTVGGLPSEGSVVRDVTFQRKPCVRQQFLPD